MSLLLLLLLVRQLAVDCIAAGRQWHLIECGSYDAKVDCKSITKLQVYYATAAIRHFNIKWLHFAIIICYYTCRGVAGDGRPVYLHLVAVKNARRSLFSAIEGDKWICFHAFNARRSCCCRCFVTRTILTDRSKQISICLINFSISSLSGFFSTILIPESATRRRMFCKVSVGVQQVAEDVGGWRCSTRQGANGQATPEIECWSATRHRIHHLFSYTYYTPIWFNEQYLYISAQVTTEFSNTIATSVACPSNEPLGHMITRENHLDLVPESKTGMKCKIVVSCYPTYAHWLNN